ncbi:hypothetical protein AGR7A_pAt30041 [Agrobacterium deltaense NCPPB 1641]|uniref:Uncharacterized protein n=1 Tax=Agrobacterium deltaense NCPPB 1641 TaxID=1183425 RepID=A0A1S7UAK6_9HYPH|nr:hypothetical protein AGR7A_pAt30041 [Agrobacterium deltaense NCPPB 1641]
MLLKLREGSWDYPLFACGDLRECGRADLAQNRHPIFDLGQTSLTILHAIHGDQALKANAHQAVGRARAFADDGLPNMVDPRGQQSGGEHISPLSLDDLAIEGELDGLLYSMQPVEHGTSGRKRLTDRPQAFPQQSAVPR